MNDSWQQTSLQTQLSNIRKQKSELMKWTANQLIFLQNIEQTIESVLQSTDPLQPPNPQNTIKLSMTDLVTHLSNIDDDSLTEGVLLQDLQDPQTQDVTLIATDATRGELSSRRSAAIAVAFSPNSNLNIATPSIFTTSTEVLEIQAMILGLTQAKNNSISLVHILVDNLAALRFLKESITIGHLSSRYIQEKLQYNSFFQDAYNEIKELEKHFSHISASHVKSHTGQSNVFCTLNDRADTLAKACNSGFLKSLTKADRENNTPLS